ncbi:MAG: 16S rRNA (guanine(527)-N(7))-methyltransferase RsmG [Pseudomonadota bacterium]
MKGRSDTPEALAELLREGAAGLDVALNAGQISQFLIYLDELRAWSAKSSLTAIRAPREIVLKHFVDSLAALPHLRPGTTLLDVGSGPGLPGLALKIARPDLRLTSVESRRRKASFQEHVARGLALEGVEVVWGRLEPDGMLLPKAAFDCAISRAVALKDFLAAAAPYVKEGGLLLAMQGRLEETAAVAPPPGLEPAGQVAYRLPILEDERSLVLFRKNREA